MSLSGTERKVVSPTDWSMKKFQRNTQETMSQTSIFNDEGFVQGMKGMSVKR
jgi:hypothetical protein